MVCTTIKNGVECTFMTPKGCSYIAGVCREIIEECKGCNRAMEVSSGWYCSSCPEPSKKWRRGSCNMATHVSVAVKKKDTKINPLKASKRASKK